MTNQLVKNSQEMSLQRQTLPLGEMWPQAYSSQIPKLSDRKIYLAHFDKQVQDFTESDGKALTDTLAYWKTCIGIKDMPSEVEISINTLFIVENYPSLTIKQIRMAIDLSLTGVLDIDPKLYNNSFAPLYIGRVLTAYQKYQAEVMNRIAKEKLAADMQVVLKPEARTYEQKVQDIRGIIISYAKLVKKTKSFEIDFRSNTFHFLKKHGLGDWSKESLDEIKALAKQDVDNSIAVGLMKKIQESLNVNEAEREQDKLLKNFGRYHFCKRFFDTIEDVDKWAAMFTDEDFYPRPKERPKELKEK